MEGGGGEVERDACFPYRRLPAHGCPFVCVLSVRAVRSTLSPPSRASTLSRSGGYTAMNRAGIMRQSSPYLRMSFETTTKFLSQALLRGEHERMVTPSARLVMGRVVDSGTGCFDLWQPVAGSGDV